MRLQRYNKFLIYANFGGEFIKKKNASLTTRELNERGAG